MEASVSTELLKASTSLPKPYYSSNNNNIDLLLNVFNIINIFNTNIYKYNQSV
jgi:hypothetical protein